MEQHPAGVVVELGAGLSTRRSRLELTARQWLGVDRPAVVELRRQLDPAGRGVAADFCDAGWTQTLPNLQRLSTAEVCFIAEGLFMYLPPPVLRRLLAELARAFPGAALLFDAYRWPAPRLTRFHDSLHRLPRDQDGEMKEGERLRSTMPPRQHVQVVESVTLRDWPEGRAVLPRRYRLPGVDRLWGMHRARLLT